MKKILTFMLLMFLPLIVNAEQIKCYYQVKVPNASDSNQFVIWINDDNTSSIETKCRLFKDSHGTLDPSVCDESCNWYNCWNENNDNDMYSHIRNGKFIYFHYGKEFYNDYKAYGNACPKLLGENGLESMYYVRMYQQQSSDSIFEAKKKEKYNNGTWVEASLEPEISAETTSCEYFVQTRVNSSIAGIKMKLEKVLNSGTNGLSYNAYITDSNSCETVELKAIEKKNNGRWQEYLGSSFTTFQIYVKEEIFKQLINNGCINNSHLTASYENTIITIGVDENANNIYDPSMFCVKDTPITEPTTPYKQNCASLLGAPTDSETPSPAYLLTFAFKVIRYIAIILLVVLTIMDFVTATASHDEDAIQKATKKAVIRLVIAIVIFVLPLLIEFILGIINDEATDLCINS